MVNEIRMPESGQTSAESQIVEWNFNEGDKVQRGDVLFTIETDKATLEVESYVEGTLLKRCYLEGATVKAGEIVAYVGSVGEVVDEICEDPNHQATESDEKEIVISKLKSPSSPAKRSVAERNLASPKARKLAKEKGIDIQLLSDSLERTVKTKDVEDAAGVDHGHAEQKTEFEAVSESGDFTPVALSSMRIAIARRMRETYEKAAMFYVGIETDMKRFINLRSEINNSIKGDEVKISFNDLLIKCIEKAVIKVPLVNSSYVNGELRMMNDLNVGIAVALDDGLVVPVVKQVNKMSLQQIAATSADLIRQARNKELKESNISGGTITLSNLGMFGIDWFTAIINQPESAILAVGSVKDKLIVMDEGQSVMRPVMSITATFDHRVIDGSVGAVFMRELKYYIENPIVAIM